MGHNEITDYQSELLDDLDDFAEVHNRYDMVDLVRVYIRLLTHISSLDPFLRPLWMKGKQQ